MNLARTTEATDVADFRDYAALQPRRRHGGLLGFDHRPTNQSGK